MSDADAVAAGLSCGGTATVFVQTRCGLPGRHLAAAAATRADVPGQRARRRPGPRVTEVLHGADVRPRPRHPDGVDVPRLFARGVERDVARARRPHSGRRHAVADHRAGRGRRRCHRDGARRQRRAARLVVGDHRRRVRRRRARATAHRERRDRGAQPRPRRSTCLRWRRRSSSRAGYVGALGSRRTQAARREGLTARGIDDAEFARIHGPAGLDIDAHTPGEIAVSIVAEILANRAGSSRRLDQPPRGTRAHRRRARAAAAVLSGVGQFTTATNIRDPAGAICAVVGRGGLALVRPQSRPAARPGRRSDNSAMTGRSARRRRRPRRTVGPLELVEAGDRVDERDVHVAVVRVERVRVVGRRRTGPRVSRSCCRR